MTELEKAEYHLQRLKDDLVYQARNGSPEQVAHCKAEIAKAEARVAKAKGEPKEAANG